MKYLIWVWVVASAVVLFCYGCSRPEAKEPKVGEATGQHCFSFKLQDASDPLLVCTPSKKLCDYLHSKANQFRDELFLEGISDCALADVQVTVK